MGTALNERASGEERGVEVWSGTQGELEVGVVFLGGHFLLAVIQGQIPEVIHLLAVCPEVTFSTGVYSTQRMP